MFQLAGSVLVAPESLPRRDGEVQCADGEFDNAHGEYARRWAILPLGAAGGAGVPLSWLS